MRTKKKKERRTTPNTGSKPYTALLFAFHFIHYLGGDKPVD